MKEVIKVPQAGESITEVSIAEINKSTGDYVEKDETILVLETDKASLDIVAEKAGVITLKVEEGDTVTIGTELCEIDTSASAPAGGASAPQAEEPSGSNGSGDATPAAATNSED